MLHWGSYCWAGPHGQELSKRALISLPYGNGTWCRILIRTWSGMHPCRLWKALRESVDTRPSIRYSATPSKQQFWCPSYLTNKQSILMSGFIVKFSAPNSVPPRASAWTACAFAPALVEKIWHCRGRCQMKGRTLYMVYSFGVQILLCFWIRSVWQYFSLDFSIILWNGCKKLTALKHFRVIIVWTKHYICKELLKHTVQWVALSYYFMKWLLWTG
jgi:hypothetical protein